MKDEEKLIRHDCDVLVAAIRAVLPADSLKNIQSKIEKTTKLGVVPRPILAYAIKQLRKYREYYGWTIPRVRCGRSMGDGRWYEIPLSAKEPMLITQDHKAHFRRGIYCDLMSKKQQSLNNAAASAAFSLHSDSPIFKHRMSELQFEEELLAKRYERLAQWIQDEGAAEAA